jgi:MFS family permease
MADGFLDRAEFAGIRPGGPRRGSQVGYRSLALLGLATACWAFSYGAEAPIASVWLEDAGHGPTVIGLNSATYYLGLALAAGLVPWLMRRTGRGCMVIGMIGSGLTIAAFPWCGGLVGAFLLRLLNGVAGAISLIPLETMLGRQARPEQRARSFGFYAVCLGIGMALGTLVGLQLYALAPRPAFLAGGAIAIAAGLLFLGWLPPVADEVDEEAHTAPLGLGRHVLSLGSAWSQGFLEAGMLALVPLFLLGIGFTKNGASWLLSGVILGVIAAQLPLGWLADRLGRASVLVGCYLAALLGLAIIPFCSGAAALAFWMWLVAACAGAFYPLGLALLSEQVPAAGLARANACFLAINCVGSLAGPVVAGAAMEWLGGTALFAAGAGALGLALAVWAIPAARAFLPARRSRLVSGPYHAFSKKQEGRVAAND